MRNIVLIPMRGGSKGIPGKNLKPLNGTPLCSYVINAALQSELTDEIWVSSEDDVIRSFVKATHPSVKLRVRPNEFATDTASTESVIFDFLNHVCLDDQDRLLLIQATSPMLSSRDIDRAINQLDRSRNKSLVSGTILKRFFWDTSGHPQNYDVNVRPRRQDFTGVFMENGALYISTVSEILKNKNRIGLPAELFVMEEKAAIEIDEITDWHIVEMLLNGKSNE